MEDEKNFDDDSEPSVTYDIAQEADKIYNVQGDIKNYISILNSRGNTDFPSQLEIMRTRLEEKKREFYTATQRRGVKSKDATNIANDAAIYRDQIDALKVLIAMDVTFPTIVSSRYDKETFEEVVHRFKQVEINAIRKDQERLSREKDRILREQEEYRRKRQNENLKQYAVIAVKILFFLLSIRLMYDFPFYFIPIFICCICGYFAYMKFKGK